MKSTAHVATDRPARYAKQLASHFSKKAESSWDGERGFVEFTPSERNNFTPSRVELSALDNELLMELDAPEEILERMEQVVARHLVMFGRKDELTVNWLREDGSAGISMTGEGQPVD